MLDLPTRSHDRKKDFSMNTDSNIAPSVSGDDTAAQATSTTNTATDAGAKKKGWFGKGAASAVHPSPGAARKITDPKKKFPALFATERAWANAMTIVSLALICLCALQAVQNINLASQLSLRPVIIVGETTAKHLQPLWPNGAGSNVCDETCIEGSLLDWIPAFRGVSGEMDVAQSTQHEMQNRSDAYIAHNSPAAMVINQYYQKYPPFLLARGGIKLTVTGLAVSPDHQTPGWYNATWTDEVTDVRTGRLIGRKPYSAHIQAQVDSNLRTEDLVRYNYGGVFITDLTIHEVH
jgi:type IV secretory pathway TrbF-like protein